ncbi:MAG: ATP-dependent helicase [Melioribacteraceae bacterium]|nr:ATP-dependent helicase [Melioribacteraceae bacterium]MCF8352843.1 ATP-dependent helicase [Melioribacteraceae bacterium]MCF8396415.1 ATP-dependent helicase [Melioribacteraceae bacterium]MCF8417360.1 ATP-dependent helicase [Melioribacteraceae bacterium]
MAKKYVLKRINSNQALQKPAFDESQFQINYRNQLNAAQYDAAKAVEGVYLVIAGAGTGKTRTLVYRVARLVEMGYEPKSILLLTFTRKAAREMMNRAALLLDNRCSKINGGTFHSFANITLRKYAKIVGLENSFTILDQGDSEDVVNLIRGQMNLPKEKKRFPNKKTLFKVFSLSVNTGITIEKLIEDDYPHFADYLPQIMDIFKIFTAYKKKNNLLDYDDLLIYLRRFLLDLSPSAKQFLSQINFTMVDEYQDTNKLQADIVRGLAQVNQNVMVVGDDSQSIYSFRGANFKNIMDFPNLFNNVEIIKLEENYRSTQEVLNFANHIIESAIEKYTKFLFTRKNGGELPAIISAANENMQSRFITERILELREEGVPLSEIAVLFRSSFFSFDLEIELNKADIPFIKFGGMKFIESAHIKDMLAFMRVSINQFDFVSWYRILLLHEGIGPKKAQQIIDELSISKISIKVHPDSALSDNKYSDKIYKLFLTLHDIQKKKRTPSEMAEIIFNYYEPLFIDKYDDYNKRKKDIEIFMNISENYSAIENFLADMALEPPQDTVIDVEAEDKENEFVTLSTIHSAKGLEWHTVFIIHAMEGFFPSSQSFENTEALEEERRLMYVAATRAKNNLYVSYPMNIFDRYQGVTLSKPSRFIHGINEELAEEWLLEEEN